MDSPAVTPKIVQVPSVGNIQFPGDMPDDQISAAIKKNYPQLSNPPMTRPEADEYLQTLAAGGTKPVQLPKQPKFADVALVNPEAPELGGPIQTISHPSFTPQEIAQGKNLVPIQDVAGIRQGLQIDATNPDLVRQREEAAYNAWKYDPSVPMAERMRRRAGTHARQVTEEQSRIDTAQNKWLQYAGGKGADAAEQILRMRFPEGEQPTEAQVGAVRSIGKNAATIAADPTTYATLAVGGMGGRLIQVPIAGLFAAGAAKNSYDVAGQLGSIWDRDDISQQQKVEMGTDLFLNTLVAGMAGAHVVKAPFLKGNESFLSSIPPEYRAAVADKVNSTLSKAGGVLSRVGDIPTELANSDLEGMSQPGLPSKAAAAVTSKVLGGGEKAMAKAPIKQQTAAGSATNAQVAQYAQSKGIDLLPGQATGSRGLQTLQAVGERSIVAPGELPEVLEKQKAAFGNAVDDFKTRVGTEAIPDTETAGLSLQSQAHHGLDTLRKSAQADYGAFQEATGDIPVDLGEVKAKYAQKLADQAEALKNVPAEYANPVRNVLNKLSGIEAGGVADPRALADFNAAVETYGLNAEQQVALRAKMGLPEAGGTAGVRMSTAQQLRSAYLDIARDYPGNVPKAVQRLAGEAARDIDAAMAKAADSVGATEQWRQANAKWKQLQDTYNNPDHPLYKVIQEADPSKVPSRLLGKGNYGGSPQTIRQLKQAGIDLSPLKREVAQQIADKNFSLTNGGRGLAGFSTEFLRELYSPQELTELQMIGRVGRAIRFEMNPSGTSNVMEGRHQLEGIIHRTAGAVVGPIASRLTTSKVLARSAIGDLSQVKPALPEAQPRGLLDILAKPPEEPPPSGPASSSGPGPTPQGQPPAPSNVPAKIADYSTWRNDNFRKSPQGGWEDASGKLYTDERLHQLHDDAVAGFQRGIKPPQRRTFERQTEADVKQFFKYRFDQLRNELKDAQAAGDQAAIADVQRRMKELDEIQRQPRALQDVLAGKPPKTAADYAAEVKGDTTPAAPEGKVQAPLMITRQMESDLRARGFTQGQINKMTPAQANAELSKVTAKSQPQSVRSAVHEVLGEHAPTTPQQAMETGATVQGNYGNDTQVKTTTGNLPAKYKVVEADSLIPSHNAQTFAKNSQYPEGVQERAYHTSKEAQARVIQQAQNYDPAYTINTNPDAVNGPPVVTKDGIVLGGNSRTMSTQRLYKSGSGDAYRADLVKNAAQFGVSPEQIAKMKQPVLVREVATPANIEQARRIGADLNKNMTGAMGTGEKAVSAGRSVKPATLATISGMVNEMGEGATLRDAMRQHGKDFVSMMVKDGVIGERERPQFIDTATGGLNEEGKTFVERALMGSVVDDPRLMDRTPKSVLNKLEGSLGDLSSVGARTDEYNLMPIIREALQEHADMAMRGLDVDKYLAQSNMFGQGGNPAVQALVRALAEKPKAFRDAMRQFAEDAKFDKQGQGLLGILHEKPSAVKAFNDAFGTNLTDEQFHDALLQSYKKEGTIGANAGQETGNPKAGESLRGNSTPQTRPGSKRRTAKASPGQQAAEQANPVAPPSLLDILNKSKGSK